MDDGEATATHGPDLDPPGGGAPTNAPFPGPPAPAATTPAFGPPDIGPHVDEPPAPPPGPASTTNGTGKRGLWVALAIGVVAIVAIGTVLVLYINAVGDKNDAEDALAETQTELADAEDALAQAEAQLSDTEASLATAQADLAQAEDDLSQAQADLAADEAELSDGSAELDDAQASAEEYRQAMLDFLTFSIATGAEFDEDQSECLSEAILDRTGPEVLMLLVEAGQGNANSDAVFELGSLMLELGPDCGISPDQFADDGPDLDALYSACEAGDGAACDDLFTQSEIDSEFETFGATCGGRFEPDEAPLECEGNMPAAP